MGGSSLLLDTVAVILRCHLPSSTDSTEFVLWKTTALRASSTACCVSVLCARTQHTVRACVEAVEASAICRNCWELNAAAVLNPNKLARADVMREMARAGERGVMATMVMGMVMKMLTMQMAMMSAMGW